MIIMHNFLRFIKLFLKNTSICLMTVDELFTGCAYKWLVNHNINLPSLVEVK